MNKYTYGTSSLELGAFLAVKFRIPDEVRRNGTSKRFNFYFHCFDQDELDTIEETTKSFWAGNEMIEPVSYFSMIKNLKGRIYDQQV